MQRHKAFTLIEIILVVVIIMLLAALILPNLIGKAKQGKIAAAVAQVSALKTAIGQFDIECGRLPRSLQDLVERPADLPQSVQWNRCLSERRVPKDPWGQDYVYRAPGTINTDGFDLVSLGPDGKEGTDDDIGNTKTE